LEQTAKSVLILDAVDEISPDYSSKVKMIIKAITDETPSNICISSGFRYRQKLEDIVEKIGFTLQPFTSENQIQYLEKYLSEVTELSNRELLTSCS
jgi:hypothetical protein